MPFIKSWPIKKRSKYRNIITVVDGIKFHSKKEAEYYGKLKLLKIAGEIISLELQVKFSLDINQKHICNYYADFVSIDKKGMRHVIDAKGYRTDEYKLKKKMMSAIWGIEIEEV